MLFRSAFAKMLTLSDGALGTRGSMNVMLSMAVGGLIGKIPVISRGQLDENLQASGERLEAMEARRTEAIMEQFAIHSESGAALFLEKLNAMDKLFNEETEYVIDGENLYIRTEDL